MNFSDDKFDVAIAGAGPAGSSAAIRLALAGLRVVLIEQKTFPRHKLCGEFISPECLVHFKELGVNLEPFVGSRIERTIFFTRSGRELAVPTSWLNNNATPALGLSRSAMDKALIDRAREVGVDVREGTQVRSLVLAEGRAAGLVTREDKQERTVGAVLVLDARGRARPLIGDAGSAPRAARQVAFKAHLDRVATDRSTCEMFVYNGGYGGCLPVENGLHNLCFIASAAAIVGHGSDPDRYMRVVLMKNRRAAKVLAEARVVGDWLAVPVQGLGPRDPSPAPGMLSIGDAAGFIDPFTGSGILLSLQSGALAADTIAERLPRLEALETVYRRRYEGAFGRRFRTSAFLRQAFRAPALAELALTMVGSSERLLRYLAVSTRAAKDGV